MHQAAAVERFPITWPKPQRLVAVCECSGQMAAAKRTIPTTCVEVISILRIELNCIIQVGDGMAVVFLVFVGFTSIGVIDSVVWIESNSLAVISDRAVEVAFGVVSDAPLGVEKRCRIESDRFAVVGDGAIIISLIVVGVAA